MPTVGFDISALDDGFKAHAHRGIGRYVRALNSYFEKNAPTSFDLKTFSHRQLLGDGVVNSCINMLPAGRQTVRQQLVYPLSLAGGILRGVDALHFPAHLDAPSWCPTRYAVTVLDLIPLVLSDLYRAENPTWRFALGRWFECKAIKNASLIFAISENTAKDVTRILGVPAERIVVTPLGVEEKFLTLAPPPPSRADEIRTRLKIPLERPFILYVGGIDQRKNCLGMISVVAELVKLYPNDATRPLLVMAGQISDDREYPKLVNCIREKGISEDVLFTGFVPDTDLLPLYAMCAVFFFLSLYEGFGLTPLEALAAGAPVVSSNRSCMPEVLGNAAILVDPEDHVQCVKELYAILSLGDRRNEYTEKGRTHARTFSWTRTGESTIAGYKRLVGVTNP